MWRLRHRCGRILVRFAKLAVTVAERLLERKPLPVPPADPNCPGCRSCAVPGVFWPTEVNGDRTRQWVTRCEWCERFNSDIAAATELVRLGHTNELGIGRPEGTGSTVPFATPAGQERRVTG